MGNVTLSKNVTITTHLKNAMPVSLDQNLIFDHTKAVNNTPIKRTC